MAKHHANDRNILIVAPPRSGASLALRLLGGLPDVVALDEPPVPGLT